MNDQIHDVEYEEVPQKTSALTVVEKDQFMPVMAMEDALVRRDAMVNFVRDIMVEDKDFGTIPGTAKPTLYKPGAEKLVTFFGLTVKQIIDKEIANWEDDGAFFYFRITTELWRGNTLIATASGSCNSKEERYRWRWVKEHQLPAGVVKDDLLNEASVVEEFAFAVEKAETSGKYGKPQSYWDKFNQAIADGSAERIDKKTRSGETYPAFRIEDVSYRIENPEIFSLENTILKMAAKRSLVAATLIGCNASEFFTQDLEDAVVDQEVIQREAVEVANGNTAPPADKKKAQSQPRGRNKKKSPVPDTPDKAIEWANEQIGNGQFPPQHYIPFASVLGYDRKDAERHSGSIKDDSGMIDWNRAVTLMISNFEANSGDVDAPPIVEDEIPF